MTNEDKNFARALPQDNFTKGLTQSKLKRTVDKRHGQKIYVSGAHVTHYFSFSISVWLPFIKVCDKLAGCCNVPSMQ